MKKTLFFLICFGFVAIGHAQSFEKYISVKDSLPQYANITAVLLSGKEFNQVVGSHCPVLAQYVFDIGWVAADRKPWKTPQISHRRFKKLNVSWWYPLPAQWPLETAKQ